MTEDRINLVSMSEQTIYNAVTDLANRTQFE
jgi:hypothetical protein